ncbi:MAG: GNAT family N-acetyltransferase [Patescibacteria group bacterium]
MTSEIKISQLVLPEQKDLARDVAELVYTEVSRMEFKPNMFGKFLKYIRGDIVIVAQDSNDLLVAAGIATPPETPRSKDAYIADLATVQSHRDRGVGRMVVGELERVAESMGAEMTTVLPLPASIGFYSRLGYEKYGEGMMAKRLS